METPSTSSSASRPVNSGGTFASTPMRVTHVQRRVPRHIHKHSFCSSSKDPYTDEPYSKCLRRIMGYRWYDFVSNQRLFREIDSRPITSIVRQRQLRLYGHVARYSEPIPACRVASVMTTQLEGGQGDAHRTLGCGKLMPPAGSY